MKKQIERQPEAIRKRREHEARNLFSRMPALYAASRNQARRILQQCGGLSVVEWRTVWDLYEAGPMHVSDLAYIQFSDHSLLSRALPAMRKKGYVKTRRDQADGRQTIVELTEAGRAAYETAAPFMARRREALRNEFSKEEMDKIITLLERLTLFFDQPLDDILKDIKDDD